MQGSYIGYYSSFPSFGGGFDSRTLLQKRKQPLSIDKGCFLFNEINPYGFVKYASRVKYCFAM